jgi:hypothetical protein
VRLIFDTDIESDVDDVGSVALLHALADRGEVEILAMGVSAKHRWSVPCLSALNTYFGRPDIPLGGVKGPGVDEGSKYAEAIAREFPIRFPPPTRPPTRHMSTERFSPRSPTRASSWSVSAS